MKEVVEVRGILGEFDIFAKLEAESQETINDVVAKIRKIPHISSTNSLTPIPSQGGK